jgi:hypothetical protein
MVNETYGWFDDAIGEPAYDPPHDAPCLYCGLRLTPCDVRTHSVMAQYGAERSYFYRTHRMCDEAATEVQKQAIMGGVLDRIGHDLGIAPGDPVV